MKRELKPIIESELKNEFMSSFTQKRSNINQHNDKNIATITNPFNINNKNDFKITENMVKGLIKSTLYVNNNNIT